MHPRVDASPGCGLRLLGPRSTMHAIRVRKTTNRRRLAQYAWPPGDAAAAAAAPSSPAARGTSRGRRRSTAVRATSSVWHAGDRVSSNPALCHVHRSNTATASSSRSSRRCCARCASPLARGACVSRPAVTSMTTRWMSFSTDVTVPRTVDVSAACGTLAATTDRTSVATSALHVGDKSRTCRKIAAWKRWSSTKRWRDAL